MKPTGKTPTFTLRVPDELRARLEALATSDRRSLANYVVNVLADHVVEETAPTRSPGGEAQAAPPATPTPGPALYSRARRRQDRDIPRAG
jgi:hypothetical protein